MVPDILQAAVMNPMMSMTSITISESLMEPQLQLASSLIPLPYPSPSFFKLLSPRIVNIMRPKRSGSTMEYPSANAVIIAAINRIKTTRRPIPTSL